MDRVLEAEVMESPEEAISYDAMDHSEPNEAFVQRLVDLGAHGHMLDIGTGPGHIPLMVCEKIEGATVFGLDMSREMLNIARQHLEASAFSHCIEYHLGDAKEIAFPDAAFDTVFSNTILHHIPDPGPFIHEAWRVLKPGGILLIRDLFRPVDQATLDHLVSEYAGDCDDYQRKMFADSLHAALTPGELRELADALGLNDVEIVIDTDRHMSLQTMSANK